MENSLEISIEIREKVVTGDKEDIEITGIIETEIEEIIEITWIIKKGDTKEATGTIVITEEIIGTGTTEVTGVKGMTEEDTMIEGVTRETSINPNEALEEEKKA
jgi:hypothetical protein